MYDLTKNPFALYEKALNPAGFDKMLADTAGAGYQYFEMSLDESDLRLARLHWTAAQRAEVRTASQNAGIPIFSACLSGHRRFPLGSADPAIERQAMDMMARAINLCGDLGIRVLQVAGYDAFYEPRTADTAARYRRNLAVSAELAARAGVMLAIEPVEVFLTSIAGTMEVIRAIESPWLALYPDVANMASLGIDPLKQWPLGRGHMVDIHMRDALPDFFYGVDLGTGIIDFESNYAALAQLCYTGPITIEMWNLENPDYLSIVTHAREFMLDKIKLSQQKRSVK